MWAWGPRIPLPSAASPLSGPLRSQALPSQLAGVGSLPKCSCPTPNPAHNRAQGLVSLRATGREVFDWILDQGYYSERDTSNVVRQVLEAVAYLHSLKIVHRNLKVRSGTWSKGQLAAGLGLGWGALWGLGLASEVLTSWSLSLPILMLFLAGAAGEPGLL